MDPDHFVLLLDRSKDEVFFWGSLPFAAPGDGVAFQRVTEIFGIQFVEKRLEVEIFAFSGELELP